MALHGACRASFTVTEEIFHMLQNEKRTSLTTRLTNHFALAATSAVIATTASADVQYTSVN